MPTSIVGMFRMGVMAQLIPGPMMSMQKLMDPMAANY